MDLEQVEGHVLLRLSSSVNHATLAPHPLGYSCHVGGGGEARATARTHGSSATVVPLIATPAGERRSDRCCRHRRRPPEADRANEERRMTLLPRALLRRRKRRGAGVLRVPLPPRGTRAAGSCYSCCALQQLIILVALGLDKRETARAFRSALSCLRCFAARLARDVHLRACALGRLVSSSPCSTSYDGGLYRWAQLGGPRARDIEHV